MYGVLTRNVPQWKSRKFFFVKTQSRRENEPQCRLPQLGLLRKSHFNLLKDLFISWSIRRLSFLSNVPLSILCSFAKSWYVIFCVLKLMKNYIFLTRSGFDCSTKPVRTRVKEAIAFSTLSDPRQVNRQSIHLLKDRCPRHLITVSADLLFSAHLEIITCLCLFKHLKIQKQPPATNNLTISLTPWWTLTAMPNRGCNISSAWLFALYSV